MSAAPRWACSELLRRHRLAGQRGLVDEQILCRDQAQVGRDHVTCRQPHDVAGYKLRDRHIDVVMRLPLSGFRRTVAAIDTIRCSLSAALFERCSWMKLSEMLRTHHDGDHDCGTLLAQEVGGGRE